MGSPLWKITGKYVPTLNYITNPLIVDFFRPKTPFLGVPSVPEL